VGISQIKLKSEGLGIFLAFISAVGSAIFMIPWKLAASSGPSAADMVLVLCVSAAALNTFALCMQRRKSLKLLRVSAMEWRLSFLFAIFTIGGNWASARSIYYLAPAVVTTLMRVEIIFVALIASYFLSEKISLRFWLGFAVVLAGFYMMQPSFDLNGEWWLGLLLAVTAALVFASKAVVTRAYIHSIDTNIVNTLRLWMAVGLWFPLQLSWPDTTKWSMEFIGLVMCAAFLGPFIGRIAFMNSSRYVEARISALVVGMSPALAVLFAWLLIDSVPSRPELFGGSLIMLGTIISLIKFKRSDLKLSAKISGKVAS
jgi:drug/metabolite transporter (DMT)-like permease